jgi:hypothetical protein
MYEITNIKNKYVGCYQFSDIFNLKIFNRLVVGGNI